MENAGNTGRTRGRTKRVRDGGRKTIPSLGHNNHLERRLMGPKMGQIPE
ncbi:hypothetical protein A2U01_0088514, partial [Trifolium medium]|nr:hypothetical protein [Trifolium medium]